MVDGSVFAVRSSLLRTRVAILHSFTLAKAFGNLFVRFDPFLSWEAGIVKHRGIPVAVAEAECQASLPRCECCIVLVGKGCKEATEREVVCSEDKGYFGIF